MIVSGSSAGAPATIPSGIAALDTQIGGVFPGRLHLMTGGPGAGKTTACLRFLHAGLRGGEPVGLITLDRLTDLASHARSTGMDLEPALRTGRLLLLRFRTEFARLLECAASPGQVIDELRRLIVEIQPMRLVVDPLTPFLTDGSASGSALAALAHLLDELGVTAIVTHPHSVADGYDARIDPIVQRAVAIVHLVRGGGVSRMQVVQTRARVVPAVVRPGSKPGRARVAAELGGAGANGARERALRDGAPT